MKTRFVLSIVTAIIFISSSSFAATIKGLVKYEGEVPKFKEIKMDADPICLTHHTAPVFPQTLLLGDGNTMGNVFVQVASGLPKQDFPAPADPVVIDQKGCMYEPHVVGVMKGQPVKVLNPDGTLHNVHALTKINPEFNQAMPKFRTEITKVFDKEEFMFALKCDVHPWMGAWLTVMGHPFYKVTEANGQFSIDNLPAGTYEIQAWHEKLGTQKQSVTVADGETKEVNFTFSKPTKS